MKQNGPITTMKDGQMMFQSSIDRFWVKVLKTESCWFWEGYIAPNGYGTFRVGQRGIAPFYAHRFVYQLLCGEIINELDHLCHTEDCKEGNNCKHRRCVNPEHLQDVPHNINMERRA